MRRANGRGCEAVVPFQMEAVEVALHLEPLSTPAVLLRPLHELSVTPVVSENSKGVQSIFVSNLMYFVHEKTIQHAMHEGGFLE